MLDSRSLPTTSPLTSAVRPSRRKPSGVAVLLQLVGGDEVRTEGGGGVLALAGAEADLHLGGLEVAGRPVVEDGVADDVVAGLLGGEVAALAADDGGDFEFEVEDLRARAARGCRRAARTSRRGCRSRTSGPRTTAPGTPAAPSTDRRTPSTCSSKVTKSRTVGGWSGGSSRTSETWGPAGRSRAAEPESSSSGRPPPPASRPVSEPTPGRAWSVPSCSTTATWRRLRYSYVAKRMAVSCRLSACGSIHLGPGARQGSQGGDRATAPPGTRGFAGQTGGATNTPRSTSLKDSLVTSSFMGLAVPHWSVTSGFEKS